jgi:threonine synthase
MKYISTRNKSIKVSFREAVLKGIPDDQGLYFPEVIPLVSKDIFKSATKPDLQETANEIAKHFTGKEIPPDVLSKMITKALNFEIPLVETEPGIFALELFHGPTLAFKDVGARFLAQCMGYFSQDSSPLTILVATSGDTGSAVANGFLGVEGVNVIVLYPSGKVSPLQEKQFTTLGKNITALEINGNFDDCQRMVKEAFADKKLKKRRKLSSANSINIARLIPQSFYYFHAWNQLKEKELPVVISVPSGNYGNLTAGLLAKEMGLPVAKFIAASNVNRPVPDYLETGIFTPRPSVETIANAMDVGNPSNFERILTLYQHSHKRITKEIAAMSFTDDQIRNIIREVYQKTGYLPDPHGATGYNALKSFLQKETARGIFLETAHPAKFHSVIREATGIEMEIPEKLKRFDEGKKQSIPMENNYEELKDFLMA